MITCAELKAEMLPNRRTVHDPGIDGFDRARERADREARGPLREPMLLGWYDRRTGAFSPRVECCSEEKPGWVVYAESRGGSLTVDVNDGSYYFIYREASTTSVD